MLWSLLDTNKQFLKGSVMGKIRKFIGFNLYDIGYRESYFKDMAKQGLILKKMGRFFATFEKGEPIDTEYRIKALVGEEKVKGTADYYWPDGVSEIAALGWINIGICGTYYVFRCIDVENFEEPPFTDAEHNKIRRRTKSFFLWLLTSIISLGMLAVQLFGVHILYERTVTVLMWTLIVMLAWCAYKDISALRLFRQYKREHYIEHDKDWETVRGTRQALNAVISVILMAGVFAILYLPFPDKTYSLNENFDIDAPVLRLSDIDNEQTRQTYDDYLRVTSSAFAPFRYELLERDLNTGNMLEVKYYMLSFKFLSEGLKEEFTDYWGDLNDYENIDYHSDKFGYIDVGTLGGRVAYIEDGNVVIFVKYQGEQSQEKFICVIEQTFGE